MSMMKILSSGIPTALAALSAVSKTGTQVNRAFALEERSWCSSSPVEYATLAGLTIPDNRWMAWHIET